MKPACFAFLLCLLAILGLVPGSCGRAESGDLVLERKLSLPEGKVPRISTGDQDPRIVVFSEKIPTRSGAPAIVVARMREVWYFDSEDLSVIHRKTYGANELICVSGDGGFIAVYKSIGHRRTQEMLHSIRVETWNGHEVWEKSMNLSRSGGFEPTATGGLVVYPTAGTSSDPPPRSDWKILPPPTPNGLMIFGADGELLLEDPAWAHLALDYEGAVSENGRYLVFTYGWTEAERRRSSELILYGDKACIALYDIAVGLKLWSHCYENVHLGRLALDASADIIVCFKAGLDQRSPAFHLSTFLTLDRAGRQLASRSLAEPDQLFSGRWPLLSPNGRHCAFTVSHYHKLNSPRVYVLDTASGDVEWEFPCPEGVDRMICRAVNDEGCAVVVAGTYYPDGFQTKLMFVDGRSIAADVDLREFGNGKAVSQVFMPATGQSIWILQGGTLSMYTIGDPCSPQGGGAK